MRRHGFLTSDLPTDFLGGPGVHTFLFLHTNRASYPNIPTGTKRPRPVHHCSVHTLKPGLGGFRLPVSYTLYNTKQGAKPFLGCLQPDLWFWQVTATRRPSGLI